MSDIQEDDELLLIRQQALHSIKSTTLRVHFTARDAHDVMLITVDPDLAMVSSVLASMLLSLATVSVGALPGLPPALLWVLISVPRWWPRPPR